MVRSSVRRIAAVVTATALVAAGAAMTGGGAGASGEGTSMSRLYGARATFSKPPDVGTVAEPLSAQPPNLAQHGYVEQEFFASGTAHAFRATSAPVRRQVDHRPAPRRPPTAPGSWSAGPRTRARFNGTVVVEWLNESAGESAPEWDYLNPELMSAGDVYVGVSAQALAVDGGTPILGSGGEHRCGPASRGARPVRNPAPPRRPVRPRHVRPDRPGRAGRRPGRARRAATPPRRGRRRVAVGLLPHHVRRRPAAAHPRVRRHLHPQPGRWRRPARRLVDHLERSAGDLRIRTDLDVPVFMFETQTDLIELGYAAAQQPNTSTDPDLGGGRHLARRRLPGGRQREPARLHHPDQHRAPARGGPGRLRRLHRVGGPRDAAALAAPFRLTSRTHPATLALDRYGNVIGGVRTPAVDVPVSTLSGAPPPGASVLCSLFGSTIPFSPRCWRRCTARRPIPGRVHHRPRPGDPPGYLLGRPPGPPGAGPTGAVPSSDILTGRRFVGSSPALRRRAEEAVRHACPLTSTSTWRTGRLGPRRRQNGDSVARLLNQACSMP